LCQRGRYCGAASDTDERYSRFTIRPRSASGSSLYRGALLSPRHQQGRNSPFGPRRLSLPTAPLLTPERPGLKTTISPHKKYKCSYCDAEFTQLYDLKSSSLETQPGKALHLSDMPDEISPVIRLKVALDVAHYGVYLSLPKVWCPVCSTQWACLPYHGTLPYEKEPRWILLW
jgi:hypothetical protein